MTIVQNNCWETNDRKEMGNEEETPKIIEKEKNLRWIQLWDWEREEY